MFARYRIHLLIALLAFACAQGWNRWNIRAMLASPEAMHQVRDGHAVKAVDDASYLQVVDRLLGDRPDLSASVLGDRPDLRAPGYRIWYLLPRLFMDPVRAVAVLIFLQCLCYALAVALLWETLVVHGITAWIRWLLCLLFAMMPTFHGFLFHTLTEGITPALSLAVLCGSLLAYTRRSRNWVLFALTAWSLLVFTRPALIWVGAALLPSAWSQWHSAKRIALIMLVALAPTAIWWVRNVMVSGGPVGLHPVYRIDEPGINRPMHGAFWALAKSWGAHGDDFHQAMEPAFRAAMNGDTSAAYADRFLQLAPGGTLTMEQTTDISGAFRRWQRFNCTLLAPALHTEPGTVPITTREEQGVILTLEQVTSDWRSEHPFHHHVRVPLNVLRDLVAHSNLNLFLFQHTLRGRPWMEALRWVSALLHIGLMITVLLAALIRVPTPLRWCAWGACAYLFLLAYVQRGIEERYTLPVLFIAVCCAASVVQRVVRANFAPKDP